MDVWVRCNDIYSSFIYTCTNTALMRKSRTQGHSDLDLWPSKCSHFIIEFKLAVVPILKEFM